MQKINGKRKRHATSTAVAIVAVIVILAIIAGIVVFLVTNPQYVYSGVTVSGYAKFNNQSADKVEFVSNNNSYTASTDNGQYSLSIPNGQAYNITSSKSTFLGLIDYNCGLENYQIKILGPSMSLNITCTS